MNMRTLLLSTAALVFASGLSCTRNNSSQPQNAPVAPEPNTSSVRIEMDATFKKILEGVEITLNVTGLSPNSEHGMHIHEKGECRAPDFASAGGHFNPHSQNHGAPGDTQSHLGDLGNITADANGKYAGVLTIKNATSSGPLSILNRSIIIHEKTDDLKTQPSGDSGNRLACVVVGTIQ